MSPYDVNSFWFRPYLDDEVCWTGTTNGSWDEYQQRQFPSFDGWNSISEQTLSDDDPENNLTPSGAKKLLLEAKKWCNSLPDVNFDAGFGGPVPFISSRLGDLRFLFNKTGEKLYLYEVSKPELYQNHIY